METTFYYIALDINYYWGSSLLDYVPDLVELNSLSFILLYWIFYALAIVLLISCFAKITHSNSSIFELSSLFGQYAMFAMIALSSMAGLPPFIGFWSKANILLFIGYSTTGWLYICCWIISVCSLFFYLNTARFIISLKKINEQDLNSVTPVRATGHILIITALLIIGCLFLGDFLLLSAVIFL